jgi:AcrR family transcriptional regulator
LPPSALSERQREIVAAARELLAAEGMEALTVGRLARSLGIKPPSLYKHFASKRHLEAAVVAEGLVEFAERLEAQRDLAAIAARYREFAHDHPALYRLMTERPLPRDLLPPGVEERAAAPVAAAVGDPDRARAAWAFAHGMVQLELADRFPPDADLSAAWATGVAAFSRRRR